MIIENALLFLRQTLTISDGDRIKDCGVLIALGVEYGISIPEEVVDRGDYVVRLDFVKWTDYAPPGALIWEG